MWIEKIFTHIEQLRAFPLSGKIVPEYQMEQVREIVFRGYRIVYYIPTPERVEEIRVIHGAKELK